MRDHDPAGRRVRHRAWRRGPVRGRAGRIGRRSTRPLMMRRMMVVPVEREAGQIHMLGHVDLVAEAEIRRQHAGGSRGRVGVGPHRGGRLQRGRRRRRLFSRHPFGRRLALARDLHLGRLALPARRVRGPPAGPVLLAVLDGLFGHLVLLVLVGRLVAVPDPFPGGTFGPDEVFPPSDEHLAAVDEVPDQGFEFGHVFEHFGPGQLEVSDVVDALHDVTGYQPSLLQRHTGSDMDGRTLARMLPLLNLVAALTPSTRPVGIFPIDEVATMNWLECLRDVAADGRERRWASAGTRSASSAMQSLILVRYRFSTASATAIISDRFATDPLE